mmetsp:Transcript_10411/g.33645  ORF Transcript_10411/g.33645 Transcript_10411/m.33645 type:complete len:205 (-) Transcript_10411:545-1159(-)
MRLQELLEPVHEGLDADDAAHRQENSRSVGFKARHLVANGVPVPGPAEGDLAGRDGGRIVHRVHPHPVPAHLSARRRSLRGRQAGPGHVVHPPEARHRLGNLDSGRARGALGVVRHPLGDLAVGVVEGGVRGGLLHERLPDAEGGGHHAADGTLVAELFQPSHGLGVEPRGPHHHPDAESERLPRGLVAGIGGGEVHQHALRAG